MPAGCAPCRTTSGSSARPRSCGTTRATSSGPVPRPTCPAAYAGAARLSAERRASSCRASSTATRTSPSAATAPAEFVARLRGADYLAQARAGGGIAATMRATRAASEDALLASARERLDAMLALGVTTVEAKTGYGLSLADELKTLRVYARLAAEGPQRIVPTLLAAHTVPPEHAGPRGVPPARLRRDRPGRGRPRRLLRRLRRAGRVHGRRGRARLRRRPRARDDAEAARGSADRHGRGRARRARRGRVARTISSASRRPASRRWPRPGRSP